MAKKKKNKGFLMMMEILGKLFKDVSKLTEPHTDKLKPIMQELLNCSEFIILKHRENPMITKNYKILKKIEDGEFKKRKEGFEVEVDDKVVRYDLIDAKRYYIYLKRKFKRMSFSQPKVKAIQVPK